MRKIVAIITLLLLLLLSSCRSTKVIERTDTITVERVVQVASSHSEGEVVHDSAVVEIIRYDTLERVTERVIVQRGKAVTKWRHDTVAIRDTVKVQSTEYEVQSTERVAVAEPVEWRKWVAVAALAIIVAALLLWAKRKGDNWSDIH